MKVITRRILKLILPQRIKSKIHEFLYFYKSLLPIAKRECNICSFKGYFRGYGVPRRSDARCPKCGSLERHRLIARAVSLGELALGTPSDACVLHFAPERALEGIFRKEYQNYRTADLFESADLVLNLESVDLPKESVDVVIANHVLEHVDDGRASRELYRILRGNGILICMVPIVEGWEKTYENPSVKSEKDRLLHFGLGDHVRYYGRDFRQRMQNAGFRLEKEITAEGEDVIRYSLIPGEKIFVFQKSDL